MTMKKSAFLFAVGLVACGSAQSAKTGGTAAESGIEEFGPGLVAHDAPVDELARDATKILGASYTLAAAETPGFVTTQWADHDAARWPGARTRVVVEITDEKVIVRVQCRHASASCVHTVPEGIELVALAQHIADDIVWTRGGGMLIGKMTAFKDAICACGDKSCIEGVETSMMDWALRNMDRLRDMKPTQAEDEAADQIEGEMDACKARFTPPEPPASARTPLPPGSTGSSACDEYLETFDDVAVKCKDKIGPALDAMKQSRDAQEQAFETWNELDDASRKAAVEAAAPACQSATDALRQAAKSMGCRL